MTYQSTTGIWYVKSGNTLYTLDVTNGVTTFRTGIQEMTMDIQCNLNGIVYVLCDNGSAILLGILNTNTGMVEEIGPIGLELTSDLAYDRNDDVFYCVGWKPSGASGLYTCDADTGDYMLIGDFEGSTEVEGIVVPYVVPGHFLAAHFSWVPAEPLPFEIIFFDATRSIVLGGDIVLYEWDWDSDGVYDEADSVPTATHFWDVPGSHTVSLRVTDDIGFTALQSHMVRVILLNHPPMKPTVDGPMNGIVNHTYAFVAGPVLDPDEDPVYCQWDWGDGNVSDWSGPYASGQIITLEHCWIAVGVYEIRVKLKDIYEAESNWSEPHEIMIMNNQSPEEPTIAGPITGKPDVTYLYVFSTTDPENDNVLYYIDWGDSSSSGWVGPYSSGIEKSASHCLSEKGTFIVKIKAKDIYGQESDWETLSVTMPCELQYFRFFDWLFERFASFFPVIWSILSS